MDKQVVVLKILLRYADLLNAGIVRNRTTLQRWIKNGEFPGSIRIGPNSAAWRAADVEAWLEQRAAADKGERES